MLFSTLLVETGFNVVKFVDLIISGNNYILTTNVSFHKMYFVSEKKKLHTKKEVLKIGTKFDYFSAVVDINQGLIFLRNIAVMKHTTCVCTAKQRMEINLTRIGAILGKKKVKQLKL